MVTLQHQREKDDVGLKRLMPRSGGGGVHYSANHAIGDSDYNRREPRGCFMIAFDFWSTIRDAG